MGTLAWVIAGAALGLVSPFMFMQFRRWRDAARAGVHLAPERRAQVIRPHNPFAAVSIRPDLQSPCEAVVKMQTQRFLAVRAPGLPVSGCDRKKCDCRYVRHDDRRASGDRRDPFGRFGGLTPTVRKERRHRERRKTSSH
jgi:hypothetical protein